MFCRREDQRQREPRRAACRAAGEARPAHLRRRQGRRAGSPRRPRPDGRFLRSRCGPAPGRGTPASASATSSISASAARISARRWPIGRCASSAIPPSTSASSPMSTARTSPRRPQDLDPHETLFIIASKTFTTLETMTNAAAGARSWTLGRDRRRGGDRAPFRRALDQCRGGGEIRHRHRQHVRLLGLGRRPLFDGFGDRPLDHDRRRAGQFPRHARRLPCDGRAFPHRAARAQHADADGAADRLVQ